MTKLAEATTTVAEWHEITTRKEELQRILALLVEFDERTGRSAKYPEGEGHWLRKAAAHLSNPEDLRIFVRPLGENMYFVICRFDTQIGSATTGWLHEDGIAVERQTAGPDHPVHQITCLHDLYSADTVLLNADTLRELPADVQSVMSADFSEGEKG